jgi:REP element-mobilizing transposase RayT
MEQQMILSEYGQIAYNEWYLSAEIREEIALDAFVVMPNHVHGIVIINDMHGNKDSRIDHVKGDPPVAPTGIGHLYGLPKGPKAKSLAAFVAGYKSSVTRKIAKLLIQNSVGATGGLTVPILSVSTESRTTETEPLKIWQRNYYEHIIRNTDSYTKISEYILNNPANWQQDKFYK